MNKNSYKSRQAQAGFTLIELIVVIVILGILAATALPKFSSLGGDARVASLQAAKGSMSATAAMAHGKYMINTGTALSTLAVEDAVITFPAAPDALTGYPKADAGFAKAAGLGDDYVVVTPATMNAATTPTVLAGEIAIVPAGVAGTATAKTCYVKYLEAAGLNKAPTYGPLPTATACQ